MTSLSSKIQAKSTIHINFTNIIPDNKKARGHPALTYNNNLNPITGPDMKDVLSDKTRPPPAKQLEDFSALNKALVIENGTVVCLINKEWLLKWREHCEKHDTQLLPPIDNSVLIDTTIPDKEHPDSEIKAVHIIKPNLELDKDYLYVSVDTWNALSSWYGGGPIIPRYMKQHTNGNAHMDITSNIPSDSDPAVTMNPHIAIDIDIYPLHPPTYEQALQSHQAASIHAMSTDIKKVHSYHSISSFPSLNTMPSIEEESSPPSDTHIDGHTTTTTTTDDMMDDNSITYGEEGGGGREKEYIENTCYVCHSKTRLRCTRCYKIYYCSVRCQQLHWRFHKVWCTRIKDDKDANSTNAATIYSKQGRVGLVNLGNSCYMNSSLQCLSHIFPLTNYFMSHQFMEQLNRDSKDGTGGRLVEEYSTLLQSLWLDDKPHQNPSKLKSILSGIRAEYAGFQQHDAHELIELLLDKLHEDVNIIKQKPYLERPEGDGSNDVAIANEAWSKQLQRDNSIIINHVGSLMKSKLQCPDCNKISVSFDYQQTMQVAIPLPKETDTRIFRVLYVPSDIPPPLIKPIPSNIELSIEFKAKLLRYHLIYTKPVEFGIEVKGTITIEQLKIKFLILLKQYYTTLYTSWLSQLQSDHPLPSIHSSMNHPLSSSSSSSSSSSQEIKSSSSQETIQATQIHFITNCVHELLHTVNTSEIYDMNHIHCFQYTDTENSEHESTRLARVFNNSKMTVQSIPRSVCLGMYTQLKYQNVLQVVIMQRMIDDKLVNHILQTTDPNNNIDSRIRSTCVKWTGYPLVIYIDSSFKCGRLRYEIWNTILRYIINVQDTGNDSDIDDTITMEVDENNTTTSTTTNIKKDNSTTSTTATANSINDIYTQYDKVKMKPIVDKLRELITKSKENNNMKLQFELSKYLPIRIMSDKCEPQFTQYWRNMYYDTSGNLRYNEDNSNNTNNINLTRNISSNDNNEILIKEYLNGDRIRINDMLQADRLLGATVPYSKTLSLHEGCGLPSHSPPLFVSVDWTQVWALLLNCKELNSTEQHTSCSVLPTSSLKMTSASSSQSLTSLELKRKALINSDTITLEKCLQEHTREEILDENNAWYCNRCKEHKCAKKIVKFWVPTLPKILIIVLKRFKFHESTSYGMTNLGMGGGGGQREKIIDYVDFPINGLDLSDFSEGFSSNGDDIQMIHTTTSTTTTSTTTTTTNATGNGNKMFPELSRNSSPTKRKEPSTTDRPPILYDLFAVCNHFGRMGYGHYTATVREWQSADNLSDQWYIYDDDVVERVTNVQKQVVSNAAYILFYKRR